MSNEFPDSDEEYELLHQDEFELLRNTTEKNVKSVPSKQTTNELRSSSNSSINKNVECTERSKGVNSPECRPSTSKDLDIKYVTNVGINEKAVHVSEKPEQRKRTYDELFGDIQDLLGTDTFPDIPEPQEKRPRWNEPDEIIKKVLGARHILHSQDSVPHKAEHVQEIKKDTISFRVPPWNFVALTRPYDSQRIYIRVRNTKSQFKNTKPVSNLLSVPYRLLKEQAEEIIVKNVERATSISQACATGEIKEDELWVDKYRPRSYVDLLSDENVNRQFLLWLKLWDKIVFNRDPILITRKKQTTLHTNKKFDETNVQELDSKGIPVHKVALLSGPPGLGKTTLAHIAAKHAGYNIVEINASDERGPDAFRQILLASTQMKSVMGADPKPNCLILDEIDGAPAASIEILLKFVQGKLFARGRKNKKNEQQPNTCHRPVICICNEPYTPSLRSLRAVALIVPVPEVTPSRLVDRLMEIACKEHLSVDPDALLMLVKRSGCDVRSCLGALQYMGNSNLGENTSLGLKDTRKGLFDSWREILMVPMNKTVPVPLSERVRNILHIIHNAETERLAQGIFHNYPTACNEKLQYISISLDWFQYFDIILNIVMSGQKWSLMPYTNHAFVSWHLYLSKAQNPKLSYPTAMHEANQKLARSNSILTTVQHASGRDVLSLVTDFSPLLPDILTPRLRTVSGHLFSAKERSDLANLVNILLDFGLTYAQEKNPDGGYEYKLDPDILEIGIFSEVKIRRTLSYAVKQIITQELETERLRRLSNITGITENKSSNYEKDTLKQSSNINDKKEPEQTTPTNVPNHLKKLESNPVQPKETVFKDFFGRVITIDQQKQNNATLQKDSIQKTSPRADKVSAHVRNALKNQGVWYKYKEGFSNAVRRNVLMEDLL